MSKLLDLYLCGIVTIGEILAVFMLALLIQAMLYRVFKVNLYGIIRNILKNIGRSIELWCGGL